MNQIIHYFGLPLPKTFLVFISLVLATIVFSIIASPILLSIAISMMMYSGMSPLVETLVRRGFSTSRAVSASMLFVILSIVLFAIVVVPIIVSQLRKFSAHIDSLDGRILNILTDLSTWTQAHANIQFDANSLSVDIVESLSSKTNQMIHNISAYFGDIAFSLLLIPLITFFLLCDFRKLRNQAMQLLPNKYFELGWIIYYRTSGQLLRYLRGISIQAIIIAVICTIGFSVAGIDYAPLLGILVGLLNMIPFFGISLAKIPPVMVVLLSEQPDVLSLVLALAVVFFAQFIDATIVIPRVVAKSANLHPLTVMLTVALAGYYYGLFGLILIVPILFSCKVVFTELYRGISRKYQTDY